jgi:pimeloyl-ACP methyl ester carboxylesterase
MAADFVLVHGAYHGAWCWERLIPALTAKGAAVTAPDLPGHGADATPTADLSLTLYADYVAEGVRARGGPVTLVGHSMAGAVIAEVAERVPDLLTRLVYLTAYMPADGENILDWARRDEDSQPAPGRSNTTAFPAWPSTARRPGTRSIRTRRKKTSIGCSPSFAPSPWRSSARSWR